MSRRLVFVEPVKDDFLCVVCREPWNPEEVSVCTTCKGSLCRLCYDEKAAKGTACLHCKVDPATFVAPHRLVRSLAEGLAVRCMQSGFGCDWTGPRSTLAGHDAACAFKPKPFTYVDEKKIPADLLCAICHAPFDKPVELPCEHVFCHQCLTDSLNVREECPVDRAPATLSAIRDAPKLIAEMTDDLLVYCANRGLKTNPCGWQGRRRDYIGHRATCDAANKTATTTATVTAPPTATAVAPPPAPSRLQVSIASEFPTFVASNVSEPFCVMAHLAAPVLEKLEDRKKPLSVSAVIDVSGSMSGQKLQTMVGALQFMVDELTERDEFGIVTFQSTVSIALPLQKMDGEGKRAALNVVRALTAGGSTNLSGGLLAGIDQVKRVDSLGLARSNSAVRATPSAARSATLKTTAWVTALRRDGKTLHRYGLKAELDETSKKYVTALQVNPGNRGVPMNGVEFTFETQEKLGALTLTITTTWGKTEAVVRLDENDVTNQTFSTATGCALTPEAEVAKVPLAKKTSGSDYCRAVMLFTDGQANIGLQEAAAFAQPMKDALSGAEDIVVHTFGFGEDHNAALLRAIAENAAGTYYFIKGVASLKESFADCLGGLLSTVAQNVTLVFTTTPNFILDRTLSSYAAKQSGDNSVSVQLRDLYSAESRDVLFLVKPRTAMALSADAMVIGSISVSYDSLLTGKPDAAQTDVRLTPSAVKFNGPANPQVAEQRARIQATETLNAVRAMADKGQVQEARAELRRMQDVVKAAPVTAVTKQLCDDMMDIDGLMNSPAQWGAEGSKVTAQYSAGHAQQRMNRAPVEMTEGLAAMDNCFKAAMRKKAK